MEEKILMAALGVLLVLAAILKLRLEQKKDAHWPLVWKVQVLIFPVLYLIAATLYCLKIVDWILPVIFLGIVEEIVCFTIRSRQKK